MISIPHLSVQCRTQFLENITRFAGALMSNDFQQDNQFNPYQSTPATFENKLPVFNKVKVQAPAIALIVFGVLSLLASIYSVVNALINLPPTVPPQGHRMKNQMFFNTCSRNSVFHPALFLLRRKLPLEVSLLSSEITNRRRNPKFSGPCPFVI